MSLRILYIYACCTGIIINLILFGYGTYHRDIGVQALSLINFILLSFIFVKR
tara:strand:+ start:37 stop:192 length:156 start_codon:yes stop_codon:yes gene_type:complete